MGLSDKVILILVKIVIIQIGCRHCMPRTLQNPSLNRFSNNFKQGKSNPTQTLFSPASLNKSLKPKSGKGQNARIYESPTKGSIFKAYNFPEIEYPLDTSPRDPFYNEINFNTNYQVNTPKIRNRNSENSAINNLKKKIKMKRKLSSNIQMYSKSSQLERENSSNKITSGPDLISLLDSRVFPEVQYPINVMETWLPNYWNQLTFMQEEKRFDGFGLPKFSSKSSENIKKPYKRLTKAKTNKFLKPYQKLKQEKKTTSTISSKRSDVNNKGANFTKTEACEKYTEDIITTDIMKTITTSSNKKNSSHSVCIDSESIPIPYRPIDTENICPVYELGNNSKVRNLNISEIMQLAELVALQPEKSKAFNDDICSKESNVNLPEKFGPDDYNKTSQQNTLNTLNNTLSQIPSNEKTLSTLDCTTNDVYSYFLPEKLPTLMPDDISPGHLEANIYKTLPTERKPENTSITIGPLSVTMPLPFADLKPNIEESSNVSSFHHTTPGTSIIIIPINNGVSRLQPQIIETKGDTPLILYIPSVQYRDIPVQYIPPNKCESSLHSNPMLKNQVCSSFSKEASLQYPTPSAVNEKQMPISLNDFGNIGSAFPIYERLPTNSMCYNNGNNPSLISEKPLFNKSLPDNNETDTAICTDQHKPLMPKWTAPSTCLHINTYPPISDSDLPLFNFPKSDLTLLNDEPYNNIMSELPIIIREANLDHFVSDNPSTDFPLPMLHHNATNSLTQETNKALPFTPISNISNNTNPPSNNLTYGIPLLMNKSINLPLPMYNHQPNVFSDLLINKDTETLQLSTPDLSSLKQPAVALETLQSTILIDDRFTTNIVKSTVQSGIPSLDQNFRDTVSTDVPVKTIPLCAEFSDGLTSNVSLAIKTALPLSVATGELPHHMKKILIDEFPTALTPEYLSHRTSTDVGPPLQISSAISSSAPVYELLSPIKQAHPENVLAEIYPANLPVVKNTLSLPEDTTIISTPTTVVPCSDMQLSLQNVQNHQNFSTVPLTYSEDTPSKLTPALPKILVTEVSSKDYDPFIQMNNVLLPNDDVFPNSALLSKVPVNELTIQRGTFPLPKNELLSETNTSGVPADSLLIPKKTFVLKEKLKELPVSMGISPMNKTNLGILLPDTSREQQHTVTPLGTSTSAIPKDRARPIPDFIVKQNRPIIQSVNEIINSPLFSDELPSPMTSVHPETQFCDVFSYNLVPEMHTKLLQKLDQNTSLISKVPTYYNLSNHSSLQETAVFNVSTDSTVEKNKNEYHLHSLQKDPSNVLITHVPVSVDELLTSTNEILLDTSVVNTDFRESALDVDILPKSVRTNVSDITLFTTSNDDLSHILLDKVVNRNISDNPLTDSIALSPQTDDLKLLVAPPVLETHKSSIPSHNQTLTMNSLPLPMNEVLSSTSLSSETVSSVLSDRVQLPEEKVIPTTLTYDVSSKSLSKPKDTYSLEVNVMPIRPSNRSCNDLPSPIDESLFSINEEVVDSLNEDIFPRNLLHATNDIPLPVRSAFLSTNLSKTGCDYLLDTINNSAINKKISGIPIPDAYDLTNTSLVDTVRFSNLSLSMNAESQDISNPNVTNIYNDSLLHLKCDTPQPGNNDSRLIEPSEGFTSKNLNLIMDNVHALDTSEYSSLSTQKLVNEISANNHLTKKIPLVMETPEGSLLSTNELVTKDKLPYTILSDIPADNLVLPIHSVIPDMTKEIVPKPSFNNGKALRINNKDYSFDIAPTLSNSGLCDITRDQMPSPETYTLSDIPIIDTTTAKRLVPTDSINEDISSSSNYNESVDYGEKKDILLSTKPIDSITEDMDKNLNISLPENNLVLPNESKKNLSAFELTVIKVLLENVLSQISKGDLNSPLEINIPVSLFSKLPSTPFPESESKPDHLSTNFTALSNDVETKNEPSADIIKDNDNKLEINLLPSVSSDGVPASMGKDILLPDNTSDDILQITNEVVDTPPLDNNLLQLNVPNTDFSAFKVTVTKILLKNVLSEIIMNGLLPKLSIADLNAMKSLHDYPPLDNFPYFMNNTFIESTFPSLFSINFSLPIDKILQIDPLSNISSDSPPVSAEKGTDLPASLTGNISPVMNKTEDITLSKNILSHTKQSFKLTATKTLLENLLSDITNGALNLPMDINIPVSSLSKLSKPCVPLSKTKSDNLSTHYFPTSMNEAGHEYEIFNISMDSLSLPKDQTQQFNSLLDVFTDSSQVSIEEDTPPADSTTDGILQDKDTSLSKNVIPRQKESEKEMSAFKLAAAKALLESVLANIYKGGLRSPENNVVPVSELPAAESLPDPPLINNVLSSMDADKSLPDITENLSLPNDEKMRLNPQSDIFFDIQPMFIKKTLLNHASSELSLDDKKLPTNTAFLGDLSEQRPNAG